MVRVVLVPKFEAENIGVIRPDALAPLLLPPRIVLIPAFRHGEIHDLAADLCPAVGGDVGIARPAQCVLLFVVKISVVELVVGGRVSVSMAVFAVAFGDVEHIAPIVLLLNRRGPVCRPPGRRLGGKQREEERSDDGENDGIHF